VLSGPSGAGKSTVVGSLRRACPQIWLSVSVTTRKPRPGEVDGREYYFVGEHDFDSMIAAGELLEWARFAGNKFGTPRTPLEEKLRAGIPALLEIDVAGARQIGRAVPGALLVCLAPPSWTERVRPAPAEPAQAELEPGGFDITLINTSVEEVCSRLVALMAAQPAE
jgi:guanylate kinase